MATQEQYSQAVLKAQLVTANDGLDLINTELSGCEADWSKSVCQFQQVQGALFCLSIGDYISDTAVYFYKVMLEIVGLNYLDGVTIDPNAQLPTGVVIVDIRGPIPTPSDESFIIV